MNENEVALVCSIPNTPPNRQPITISQLLRDALAEFISQRTPAREYVERRYPDGFLGDKRNNERKVMEVESRVLTAKRMLETFDVSIAEGGD